VYDRHHHWLRRMYRFCIGGCWKVLLKLVLLCTTNTQVYITEVKGVERERERSLREDDNSRYLLRWNRRRASDNLLPNSQ